MSGVNGTALETSPNGIGVADRKINGSAPSAAAGEGQQNSDGLAVAVGALAARVEFAEQVVGLQASTALVDYMEPEEIDRERAVGQRHREVERELQTWKINRSLGRRKRVERWADFRAWLDQRAARKDVGESARDRRWHLRAERTRKRLTSTDAKIATQIRSATLWSNILITLMILGMIYTGFTIQHNFGASMAKTDPRYWLLLGLEAMASAALMALMRFDARAALAGLTSAAAAAKGWLRNPAVKGWLVKAALLGASVVAAAGPAIRSGDVYAILADAWAPLLVAAVLLIHDRISRGDAQILAALYSAVDGERLADLVRHIEFALLYGLLPGSQTNGPGEVAPSASKIQSFLRVSKGDAGLIRDEVNARAAQA